MTRVRRRDLRLLPGVALVWAGTLSATHRPDHAAALVIVCAALTAGLLGVATLRGRRPVAAGDARRRSFAGLLAVGVALAGAGAFHVLAASPARDAATALPIEGGRSLTWETRVVGKVERSATGWSFDAIVDRAGVGAVTRTIGVPVRVWLRQAHEPGGRASGEVNGPAIPGPPLTDLDLGATAVIRGAATPSDAGERAVLVISADDVQIRDPPRGVLAAGSALRRGLQSAVADLPQPGAGLIAGLAVGDTVGVLPELEEQMRAASLSHLTAVSGANCALVVGLLYGLAALCRAPRGARVTVALLGLAAFVVLVSPEPSVVRAATMATIALLSLLWGRAGAGVSVLAVAVIALLIVDPWLSGSLGFALSAAATAALLLLAGPLADGLSRWMPSPLALALAVPLSAQLACGPLLILVEPSIPVYGVLANLIAGPAAPLATVLGLVACLTSGVPFVGTGVGALAWLPAAWIAATAEQVTELPSATLPWLEGEVGVLALLVVNIAVVTAVILPDPLGVRGRRGRRVVPIVSAIVVVGGLAAGPLATVIGRLQTPTGWTVAACDVGQGDAVLVRSAGRVALIDTGPEPDALRRCLDRFGVARIDLLVLTHFDLDHRGGVEAVVGRTGMVLHGPVDRDDASLTVRRLVAGGARVHEVAAGHRGSLGGTAWRVLWPRPGSEAGGNDASVVLELAGGGVPRAIFLGDLSAEPQIAVSGEVTGDYDIVKVAHHGSADQYRPLYERIAAEVALVTVGENDYGHPRQEILEILDGTGAHILRTDEDGSVAVHEQDGAFSLWRERGR